MTSRNSAGIRRRAGRIAIPAVGRDAGFGAAREQFERLRHQIVSGGEQKVAFGERERHRAFGCRVRAQVEGHAARLALFELVADGPQLRLHEVAVGDAADVQELDIANLVERQGGIRSGDLDSSLRPGRSPAASPYSPYTSLQLGEQVGAGKYGVIVALQPIGLDLRCIPIAQQAAEIRRFQVEQRAAGHQGRQVWRRRRCLQKDQSRGGQQQHGGQQGSLHCALPRLLIRIRGRTTLVLLDYILDRRLPRGVLRAAILLGDESVQMALERSAFGGGRRSMAVRR
jgi:hypothetical protein